MQKELTLRTQLGHGVASWPLLEIAQILHHSVLDCERLIISTALIFSSLLLN